MVFDNLKIERRTWGKGELTGTIAFTGKAGRINLRLNDGHINRIFEIVADTMIETAKEAAQELICNIIEHKESLENKQ